MKIRSVTLEGFQSYNERETIDLDGHNLVAIVGRNHSGKSTIFDAIQWALWGYTRGSIRSDVISRGRDRAEVTVEFDLGEDSYRMTRSRSLKGRHEAMLCIADPTTPHGWRELTEKNPLQADPYVADLLGMTATVARATWIVGQGDVDGFCAMDPSPRRQVLANIFSLDRFIALADAAEAKRKTASEDADKARWEQDSLATRIATLKGAADGAFAGSTVERLADDAKDAEAVAEAAVAALAALDDGAETQLKAAAQAARRALDEFLQAELALADRYANDLRRIDREIATAQQSLQRATNALEEAQAAVWEIDSAEKVLAEASKKVAELETESSETQALLARLNSDLAATRKEQESITARGAEINERRGPLVASLDKGEGECFTCGQSLTREQATTLVAELDAQRKDLLRQYSEVGERADRIATDGRDAEIHLNALASQVRAARVAERKAEQSKVDIERLAASEEARQETVNEAGSRLAELTKERANLGEPPVKNEERAKELTEAVNAAEAKLAAVSGGAEERRRLTAERDGARAKVRDIWNEQQRRQQAEAELAEIEPRLTEVTDELAKMEKAVFHYGVIADGYRPSGVPSMILAGIVEELNEEANDFLSTMDSDGLGVSVSTQRETQKGTVSEKLMIYAITNLGQVDFKTLSGSEKFRVALALRLGLARCIARRTGTPMLTIIVDEGWGALDAETRLAVQDVFMRLSDEFTILTISHEEDVANAFPTVVEVDASTGTSRTTVIER